MSEVLKIFCYWYYFQVGSESSGKNAMVGILAKLCGQHLNVLSMNSGMDTTDFIGGFEQVNWNNWYLID